MIEYNKRLVEVDEILRHLCQTDYNKIPEEIKEVIEKNKDKEYVWKYDNTKKLKEQDVSDDTIAIVSYINMEYLLNDEQKKFVERLHEQNAKNQAINANYNTDIFYNKSNETNNKTTSNCEELVLEKSTQNFLQKLTNFIRNLFLKNK